MKCLSVRQPWAWLLVNGYKDCENRTWTTRHRGPLLIHAGKAFDDAGYAWVAYTFPEIKLPEMGSFSLGCIVGRVIVLGMVCWYESPWFEGPWCWLVNEAVSFTQPTPYRGALKLFDVEMPL